MKTKLPKRSLVVKERLDAIVEEILAVAKNELAMIILFGSYARGTWVIDSYVEGHITYSYVSDIDIMLVTKSPKYAGFQDSVLENKIEDRLDCKGLNEILRFNPHVTLITETIGRFNKELEKSQYFFSDIKKEGILLYDSGEFTLAEPRDLSWPERKEIAQDYYDGFLMVMYSWMILLIPRRGEILGTVLFICIKQQRVFIMQFCWSLAIIKAEPMILRIRWSSQ